MRPLLSSAVLRGRLVLAVGVVLASAVLHARQGELPYSLAHPAKAGFDVPIVDAGAIDADAERLAVDRMRTASGLLTKRQLVALPRALAATTADGHWQKLEDGSTLWRLRVRAQGATDLSLRFPRFDLPAGARLYLIGADGFYQGPYSGKDANAIGFDSPIVPGDVATIELQLPAGVELGRDAFAVGDVAAGFSDPFGRSVAKATGPGTSGTCNIDVACPLGVDYADEIRAVGHFRFKDASDGKTYICTGTLINDVPQDKKPWLVTAAHCIDHPDEAASVVVYWNYQSTACGRLAAPARGFFTDDLHGATLRATRADVDVTLLELTALDPAWKLFFAGWDAIGAGPSTTIGIHHPKGDVKKITTGPKPMVTRNCTQAGSAAGTHWWTGPYTQGTTEGGSSGSGLFAVAGDGNGRGKRLIGTLSGGGAECSATAPTQPNEGNDCYGRLSVAWDGANAAARLKDWLDPANTGTSTIGGIDQNSSNPPPADTAPVRPQTLPPELSASRIRK